jgi:flagellin
MGFQQGFRINTNTSSLDTYRNYSASQAGMERNIERLSSGLRINKAADDSAGLSISNRMDNQVRGMQQANRNVQQGNNLLQTAEGAMNEIGNILGRMRELAVQSASDTVNETDRDSLNLEFEQLSAEIDRIAESTKYNGTTLLTGSFDGSTDAKDITLQVGADNDANNRLEIQLGDFKMDSAKFGGTDSVNAGASSVGAVVDTTDTGAEASSGKFLDLNTLDSSQKSITNLDALIGAVNNARSEVGATQNQLEFTSSNLMNSIQNNAASMSTIRDADFAAEAADLAKNQILVQSGTSMLAQANGLSQNVLALIR